MKLEKRRKVLSAVLVVIVARARGELTVPFKDEYAHGVVEVGIGSPATHYTLLLDTAAANTWVGADKPYSRTSTSQKTANRVTAIEGSGSFNGQEYWDNISLGGATFEQSIGVAESSKGYHGVDGVLGLGQTQRTRGTLYPDTDVEVPTVPDKLFSTEAVDSATVTIGNGLITFGSSPVEVSNMIYTPVTNSTPADNFWGIDASFAYGNTSLVSTTSGTIDHATTLTLLPTGAYKRFLKLTKAVEDRKTGLPMLDRCTFLRPLNLTLGGNLLEIPVESYRWPAAQNTDIGGDPGRCYLAVGNTGLSAGNGIDFIIGYNTLKHLTVVLDKENSRVGFAKAEIED